MLSTLEGFESYADPDGALNSGDVRVRMSGNQAVADEDDDLGARRGSSAW